MVVIKFHYNQNLPKNTKLNINNTIKPIFNNNPNPSPGNNLKLTFKYPNNPYKNTSVNIAINITTKIVKVGGGSILT